jgi:hypothetical protein
VKNRRTTIALIALLSMSAAFAARAQEPQAPAAGQGTPPGSAEQAARQKAADAAGVARLNDKTPLEVQVVVSRYAGEKRISSMPFVLTVNAVGSSQLLGVAENARLRMGSRVPGLSGGPVDEVYIGTNIDCRARSMGDGRFELSVSIEDFSLATDGPVPATGTIPVTPSGRPIVRSFTSSQNLILRNGESRQFTAATDRVSGETVRIDVTMKVVK